MSVSSCMWKTVDMKRDRRLTWIPILQTKTNGLVFLIKTWMLTLKVQSVILAELSWRLKLAVLNINNQPRAASPQALEKTTTLKCLNEDAGGRAFWLTWLTCLLILMLVMHGFCIFPSCLQPEEFLFWADIYSVNCLNNTFLSKLYTHHIYFHIILNIHNIHTKIHINKS